MNEIESTLGDWYDEISAQVVLNYEKVVVLGVYSNSYNGGGKAERNVDYIIYDYRENQLVDLSHLIKQSSKSKLKELITIEAKSQLGLSEEESLSDAGFGRDMIFPSDSYYITTNQLVFYYPPYSFGNIEEEYEFGIPYEKLKHYLMPNSVIDRLMN